MIRDTDKPHLVPNLIMLHHYHKWQDHGVDVENVVVDEHQECGLVPGIRPC